MEPIQARAAAALVLLQLSLLVGSGIVRVAQASLPPVHCSDDGCTIANAWGLWADRQNCKCHQVVYPTREQELVAAVATAVRTKTKLKVISRWSHSAPKLVCPAGDHGTLISTRDFNRTVHVDAKAGTVTVDAGVMLNDLLEILEHQGVTIAKVPYWSGVSIAGLISTGAHGSSLWGKGGAVHESVTRIRIVVPAPASEGYATVKTFSAATNPQELAAAKVSLGVLGAISQVTLQIEPQFKRSVTHDLTSDEELETRLFETAKYQEFGDIRWFPSLGQIMYRADNRVPLSTPGDGAYDLFRPAPAQPVIAARAGEVALERSRNAPGQCQLAAASVQNAAQSGFGAGNNKTSGLFEGYPVVGYNHLMTTSRATCVDGIVDYENLTNPSNQLCAIFDLATSNGPSYYDVAMSLPVHKMPLFVADIRKLVKLRPFGLCPADATFGFLMRFVKGESSAFLGVSEDSVDMDLVYFRADDDRTPRLNNDVLDEAEQILMFKYGGKPHWGKNRPVGFTGAAAKYPRLKKFLEVKNKLDPEGFFSSEWSDAVLGIRGEVTQVKPYCALAGLCVCSQDVHCAPEAGYFCRPGLVYKEARVCRYEGRRQS